MEQSSALARTPPRAVIIAAQVVFVAALVAVVLYLTLRPNDDALIRQADLWMKAGRYNYALNAYTTALEHNANNRAARLGVARADYALHNYTAAVSLSTPLLSDSDPAWHAATLALIGMAATALGQDGRRYLQAAASLTLPETSYRIAQRHLAETDWAKQDYAAALAAYHKIDSSLDQPSINTSASQPEWDFVPFDAASDRQRAVYYATLFHAADNFTNTLGIMQSLTLPELRGNASAFAASLTKSLPQTNGDAVAITTSLGVAYTAIGECGLARQTLDAAAAQMNPSRPSADLFAYRSVCRLRSGDDKGAQADLQLALKIDPNSGLAHQLYAEYYLNQSQPDTVHAQEELDSARDADATNPLVYLDYYNLDLAEGNYTDAEQNLTAFAGLAQGKDELNSLSPKARLADFYLDTGYNLCNNTGFDVAEAAGQAGDAAGLDAQGWAEHLCDSDPPWAGLDPLARAAQLDPQSARIHYHLGTVYAEYGQTAAARDQLMWAQDLDPGSDIARRALQLMARLPNG